MTLPVQQIFDKYLLKVINNLYMCQRLELSLVSDVIEPKPR